MLVLTYDRNIVLMKGVSDMGYKLEVMTTKEALEDYLVLAEEEEDEEESAPLMDCSGLHHISLDTIHLSCIPIQNDELLFPKYNQNARTLLIDFTTTKVMYCWRVDEDVGSVTSTLFINITRML